jgi:hypothetical protein
LETLRQESAATAAAHDIEGGDEPKDKKNVKALKRHLGAGFGSYLGGTASLPLTAAGLMHPLGHFVGAPAMAGLGAGRILGEFGIKPPKAEPAKDKSRLMELLAGIAGGGAGYAFGPEVFGEDGPFSRGLGMMAGGTLGTLGGMGLRKVIELLKGKRKEPREDEVAAERKKKDEEDEQSKAASVGDMVKAALTTEQMLQFPQGRQLLADMGIISAGPGSKLGNIVGSDALRIQGGAMVAPSPAAVAKLDARLAPVLEGIQARNAAGKPLMPVQQAYSSMMATPIDPATGAPVWSRHFDAQGRPLPGNAPGGVMPAQAAAKAPKAAPAQAAAKAPKAAPAQAAAKAGPSFWSRLKGGGSRLWDALKGFGGRHGKLLRYGGGAAAAGLGGLLLWKLFGGGGGSTPKAPQQVAAGPMPYQPMMMQPMMPPMGPYNPAMADYYRAMGQM